MGNTGKAKNPKKTKAVRENAKAPRGRWANTEERKQLEIAKHKGRMAAPRLLEMLLGKAFNPNEETANRIMAAKTVMDRCGMPVVTSAEVRMEGGGLPVVLVDIPKDKDGVNALGWPAALAPAGGD